MSEFSRLIWVSRSLTCVTSSVIRLSTVVESWLIWVVMRSASERKLETEFSAWPRSRLDDGSLAEAANDEEISSGRLKKKPSPDGSPNSVWALSRNCEVMS